MNERIKLVAIYVENEVLCKIIRTSFLKSIVKLYRRAIKASFPLSNNNSTEKVLEEAVNGWLCHQKKTKSKTNMLQCALLW